MEEKINAHFLVIKEENTYNDAVEYDNEFKVEYVHSEVNIDENEKLKCEELNSGPVEVVSSVDQNENLPFTSILLEEDYQLNYIKEEFEENADYVCDTLISPESFQESSRYIRRKKRFIYSKRTNFRCTYCKSKFHCKSDLNIHKICHADEKPYECDICGLLYRTKNSLKYHLFVNHSIFTNVIFKRTFNNSFWLKPRSCYF